MKYLVFESYAYYDKYCDEDLTLNGTSKTFITSSLKKAYKWAEEVAEEYVEEVVSAYCDIETEKEQADLLRNEFLVFENERKEEYFEKNKPLAIVEACRNTSYCTEKLEICVVRIA